MKMTITNTVFRLLDIAKNVLLESLESGNLLTLIETGSVSLSTITVLAPPITHGCLQNLEDVAPSVVRQVGFILTTTIKIIGYEDSCARTAIMELESFMMTQHYLRRQWSI